MPALIALLGSVFARFFTDAVLRWIALKVILTFLFTIVVPIVLTNFLYEIIEIVMNFANSQSSGASAFNGSMSFTGFAAWLIQCFRLAECLAVFVSALVLRLTLSMIPFVRL